MSLAYRRSPRLLAASSALVFGWLSAGTSKADLDPAFANKVTVDPTWATGVNGVTDLAFAADGRAVIITKDGDIKIRETNGTLKNISGTFPNLDKESEKGLLGIVAHPGVPDTFYFYVSNGPSNDDKHYVYKGTLSATGELSIDTQNPIIGAVRNNGPGLEGPANHDGGGLIIYNNQLYISTGDTGANASPPTNKYGSCLNKGNGKILRVNLDGSIPNDNPLVNLAEVTGCNSTNGAFQMLPPDKRIFAWGFRNPWRFWIDPTTGKLWIGDVGEGAREEISVGGGDQHYGYPFYEGTQDWNNNAQRLGADCDTNFTPARACTPPVHDYDHSGNNENERRRSVTGGLIPAGCGWSKVFDGTTQYLFGEYNKGWIHALQVNQDRSGVTNGNSPTVFFTSSGGPVSFRQGPDGSVYVAFINVGAVYQFTPTDRTGPDCQPGMPATGGAPNAGGAGGSGGTAGSAPQMGGMSSVGGASPAGGTTSSGGAPNASGGTASATGGAPPTAGPVSGDGESEGCGCRAGSGAGGAATVLSALVLLGAGLVRRHKTRNGPRVS